MASLIARASDVSWKIVHQVSLSARVISDTRDAPDRSRYPDSVVSTKTRTICAHNSSMVSSLPTNGSEMRKTEYKSSQAQNSIPRWGHRLECSCRTSTNDPTITLKWTSIPVQVMPTGPISKNTASKQVVEAGEVQPEKPSVRLVHFPCLICRACRCGGHCREIPEPST